MLYEVITHVLLCLLHCLPCIAFRSEAVAEFGETRVNLWAEYLRDRLLDESVYYRWDPQCSDIPIRFRDIDSANSSRQIASVNQSLSDAGPVALQPGF